MGATRILAAIAIVLVVCSFVFPNDVLVKVAVLLLAIIFFLP